MARQVLIGGEEMVSKAICWRGLRQLAYASSKISPLLLKKGEGGLFREDMASTANKTHGKK